MLDGLFVCFFVIVGPKNEKIIKIGDFRYFFFLKIFFSWPIRTGKKVLVLWPALSNKFATIYIIDVGWFVCLFFCYCWAKKIKLSLKLVIFEKNFWKKIFFWPIWTWKKVLVLWPALSNKFATVYIIDVGCFVCLFVCYRWAKKCPKWPFLIGYLNF